jgi:hypothetical protein
LFADFASAIIKMEQKNVYILNRALTLTTNGTMTKKKLEGRKGGEAFHLRDTKK